VQGDEFSYWFDFLILNVFVENGELQTPANSDPESCFLFPLKRDFLGPSHSECLAPAGHQKKIPQLLIPCPSYFSDIVTLAPEEGLATNSPCFGTLNAV
jgi:hypothetical protein